MVIAEIPQGFMIIDMSPMHFIVWEVFSGFRKCDSDTQDPEPKRIYISLL